MPRRLALIALLSLLAACAPPRLYSEDGDLPEVGSGSDWVAPENGWDKGAPPPAELEGEGFGGFVGLVGWGGLCWWWCWWWWRVGG